MYSRIFEKFLISSLYATVFPPLYVLFVLYHKANEINRQNFIHITNTVLEIQINM